MKKSDYDNYTLQEQIRQKNSEYPFFGTEKGVSSNITTYTHFPPKSKELERETGMINPKSLKYKQYDDVVEHDFDVCFQTACNITFPCTKKEKKCFTIYR